MKLKQKLMKIRCSVDYLQKTHQNVQQQFKYVSSSQVLGSVRKKMNELGVILRPQILDARFHHKGTLNEKMHMTELVMAMTWVDTESGEEEINNWYSQGADQHEKGVSKALTLGEKFFILKYFNIPTDEFDPDAFEDRFGGSDEGSKTPEKGSKTPNKDTSQPTMPQGPYKNHGERIRAFIQGCQTFKNALGEDRYYEILGQYGFEKSNLVRKRDDMNAIYKAFKEALAADLEGEVVK
jgi:hypothetical protein